MDTSTQDKDPVLWKEAERRAGFKRHLIAYLVLQVFFWMVWLLSKSSGNVSHDAGAPWPIKVALGWGIGLLFHAAGVYLFRQDKLVEKEYENLKNKQQ